MRKLLIAPFLGLILVYRYLISPMLPRGCRHFPSCSSYSADALRIHGLIKGGSLSVNRIARCQPWGTSGYDPVPRIIVKKISPARLSKGDRKVYPCCDRLKQH